MKVASWYIFADPGVSVQTGGSPSAPPPFNGKAGFPLIFDNNGASGWGGVANRGMGGEGIAITAGGVYEGFVFVSGASVPVRVQLVDFTTNTTLAEQILMPTGSIDYERLNFTLPAASAGTSCVSIPAGSDPTIDCGNTPSSADVCVRCGGELRVSFNVTTNGSDFPPFAAMIYLGYVWLQPGTWGRVGDLPVLKSAGDLVTEMGISVIRQGGTVSQSFRWKDWRGDPWARPAMGHTWGDSLVDPWGPFEVRGSGRRGRVGGKLCFTRAHAIMDATRRRPPTLSNPTPPITQMMNLADFMGFEMILTLAYDLNNATDFADLVEYVWGDATTTWGNQRILDGHASPYNISIFELGNEQPNPNFVEQITAMEARASSLGRAGELRWMYPTNDGVSQATAGALVAAGIAPNRVMPDIHIGAGGALDVAEADFARLPDFAQSAINCETNAGTHDMGRALGEAADLLAWFSVLPPFSDRLVARTASFCTERSGNFDGFSQGLSFFLPDHTWLQPPGHVHAMIKATWGDQGLGVVYAAPQQRRGAAAGVVLTAQAASSTGDVFVRIANPLATAQNISLTLTGAAISPKVTTWTLAAATTSAANTPAQPNAVAPQQGSFTYTAGASVAVPAYSFSVFAFTRA